MDIQFTDREIDVMEVLWERGPSLVSEVRAALKDDLAYTTVLTILRTLEGKRYVGHEQEGRGYRYFAAVKRQAAQQSALRHLTSKLFKGSAELLVFDQKLSAKQISNMRALLEGKSPKREN
jgi:predicted transcriptional regulator